MALNITINGQPRSFNALNSGGSVAQLIDELALKSDRIAVEVNGELAARAIWPTLTLEDNDRLEIVHFVGGGLSTSAHGSTAEAPVTAAIALRSNESAISNR